MLLCWKSLNNKRLTHKFSAYVLNMWNPFLHSAFKYLSLLLLCCFLWVSFCAALFTVNYFLFCFVALNFIQYNTFNNSSLLLFELWFQVWKCSSGSHLSQPSFKHEEEIQARTHAHSASVPSFLQLLQDINILRNIWHTHCMYNIIPILITHSRVKLAQSGLYIVCIWKVSMCSLSCRNHCTVFLSIMDVFSLPS